ncbi:hypothetical protein Syun_014349 [Stephania yunnanensis]|uniref:Uncharacterized protein n=1 Tax=Stephania yunnanensis TaxID=152371 RepID=A0AAP0JJK0_9MAGN
MLTNHRVWENQCTHTCTSEPRIKHYHSKYLKNRPTIGEYAVKHPHTTRVPQHLFQQPQPSRTIFNPPRRDVSGALR